MPFRRVGKIVQVQKGGKWQHKTTHPSEEAAPDRSMKSKQRLAMKRRSR